jgi:MFS family permease
MEHTPSKRIGLASSLIQASTCLGLLAGTTLSSLISFLLTDSQFENWGWRVPFLVGLLAAWIGFKIRKGMPESALYEAAKAENLLHHNPIRIIVQHHLGKVFTGLAILVPMTFCFFFAFVFFNSFMMTNLAYPASRALMNTSAAILLSLMTTIWSGWLADRVGYKRILLTGVLMLLASAQLITRLLSGELSESLIFPGLLLFAFLIGIYTSSAFAAVAGLFSTEIRYSGVSFAVNIASPLFGSTAPLLATWLIQEYGVESGFETIGYYLMALCLLALMAIFKIDHDAFLHWGKANRPQGQKNQ